MLSLVTDLCDALGVEACSVSLHWRAIMVPFAPCRRCRLVRFSGCFASDRHLRAGCFMDGSPKPALPFHIWPHLVKKTVSSGGHCG
ncbi:hypothetical protein PhaeoP10_02509 [Phaeobacter inhibens]|nr:hypothetical protein PhaeoP10_02509 [Phaeobacter inhibens]